MSSQRELFAGNLNLTAPAEVLEPRFWVKRLVIWSAPATVLRDVPLRPGMNIVWSPDPGDSEFNGIVDDSIGHGSGKTMFCRFLRYGLGEDTFGGSVQREKIANAFPDGYIGLEVALDGAVWAVARPIGFRRRHFAIEGGDLDTLLSSDAPANGIEPFLSAVTTRLLAEDTVRLLPRSVQGPRAWLIALAWATRDQECRFDHALDWRSSSSESRSPVRDLTRLEVRNAVRAFLGALTSNELDTIERLASLERGADAAESELAKRAWEIDSLRTRLLVGLGVSDEATSGGDLDVVAMKALAAERMAKVVDSASTPDLTKLAVARVAERAARDRLSKLEEKSGSIAARIETEEKLLAAYNGELAVRFVEQDKARQPICRLCEVPIDRVLADGCKLSHKLPDFEAIKARHETCQRNVIDQKNSLESIRAESRGLPADMAVARQVHETTLRALEGLDRQRDSHNDDVFRLRRLLADIHDFENLLSQRDERRKLSDGGAVNVTLAKQQLDFLRAQQSAVFGQLTSHFNAIVQALVGRTAAGRVGLTPQGLDLKIDLGGDRSTAAIESLKVLAFDLAVLCLGIEGRTHVPAFLVHDSPREADLGKSIYDRLFHFAAGLEQIKNPTFQYIITTTTSPPEHYVNPPWVRLIIRGAPPPKRLLGRDL